jgi:uncharacterized repeat protein (TIGR04076 family)
MYELKATVTKVLGECTADPPMNPGDYFTVRDGDIRVPEGKYVCLWALQSLLPVITPKEREIVEDKGEDWLWRVHHVQCPDPAGRVIFRIDRTGKVRKGTEGPVSEETEKRANRVSTAVEEQASEGGLRSLRVVVEEVRGKCTSGMRPGDHFILCSGRLYIPADRHFCLYALHAALPFLAAKQRHLEDGDWMKGDFRVICPDPAGNVVMRVEYLG